MPAIAERSPQRMKRFHPQAIVQYNRRIGYAVRYIPTNIRQVKGIRDSAALVRGVDRFGNFNVKRVPAADFYPDAVAYHTAMLTAMLERQTAIRYAGADKQPDFTAH